MSELEEFQGRLEKAREGRDAAADRFYARRAELAAVEARLAALRRVGAVTGADDDPEPRDERAEALIGHRAQLAEEIAGLQTELARQRDVADRFAVDVFELADPRELVGSLGDRAPFLLLPVRVEARFFGRELRVRFFPDDVAVQSHEPALTEEEVAAGQAYWREVWRAGGDDARERDAWRALVAGFGGPRAAWIAAAVRPGNDGERPAEPLPPDAPLEPPPAFPEVVRKESDWTRPPVVRVLPDRFVVTLYRDGAEPREVLGNRVPDPLVVGPDPLQVEGRLEHDGADLKVDPALLWMTDFDEAERVGMAVRVALSAAEATEGFDRLTVLGVRFGSSEDDGRRRLAELFTDHRFAAGLALVPQGTPTNNTGSAAAGFDRRDESGEGTFDVETGDPLFDPAVEEHDKSDGQRLCEALALPYPVFQHVRGAGGRDLAEAEAMNAALFPGTLGYYLEEMLRPVVGTAAIRRVRSFFVRHVRGRGALPAIRVGTQPYGLLLTSALSRYRLDKDDEAAVGGIWDVVSRLDDIWERLAATVARVGAGGDPEATILDVLGLHATSVEYHARHMVGPEYLWNVLVFGGAGDFARRWHGLQGLVALALLVDLGFGRDDLGELPRIFEMKFFKRQSRLTGPLIDAAPLSETAVLPPVSEAGESYIAWLAGARLDEVRDQVLGRDAEGEAIEPPRALLYLLLRHSLLLEYWDTALRLHVRHRDLPESHRAEVELMHLEDRPTVTRWDYLDLPVAAVSGEAPIKTVLETPDLGLVDAEEVRELAAVKAALGELQDLPTARLERLLAEHVDLCGYRLDAWRQGFLHRRLLQLRTLVTDETGEFGRQSGLYLGAYGWLEDLRPRPAPLEVPAADPAVAAVGGVDALPGEGPVVERPDNGGFVQAPSLGHARAAAVLRSGFLTHGGGGSDELAVDLSSERVRRALGLVEGIRSGQSLEAILGYRFERGLHDRSPELELDRFILDIRQRFPLAADKVHPADGDVRAAEARQVLDGVALVKAARDGGYPYGVAGLPAADSPDPNDRALAAAIAAEVDRIADSLDAVGDLGLAESVYQVVQGNFERAGAALDALSRGGAPTEPEVVRTPRGGVAVSHRLGAFFDAEAPAASPWPGVPLTPRARAEPMVNRWLAGYLGADPGRIRAVVEFETEPPTTVTVSAADLRLGEIDPALGLQPIDLVLLAGGELAETTGGGELELRVVGAARRRAAVPDGVPALVRWTSRDGFAGPRETTFWEALPLLRALRELLGGARPLTAEDLVPPADDPPDPDDRQRLLLTDLQSRVAAARAELADAETALAGARAPVAAAVAEPPGGPLTGALLDDLRSALSRLAAFGLPDLVPRSVTDVTAEAAPSLLDQAAVAARLLADRTRAADALLAAPAEPEEKAQTARRLLDAARAVLGRDMVLAPRFTLADASELRLAAGAAATLLADAPPLAVDEWLASAGRVRQAVADYGRARLLARLFGNAPGAPEPLQLPFREDDRWLALPVAADREVLGDTLAMVLERPASFGAASTFAGLQLDEWVEVLPNRHETTGIAFHFDQPNSEPPQCLLLVVPSEVTGRWSWDDLRDALTDTLAEARRRAVEPDQLQDTVMDQLTPAVTPAVSHLPATIALDLRANVVVSLAVTAVLESE